MKELFLVTDTHPLVWYISEKFNKLPRRVFSAFKAAEEGSGVFIWIPAIVVWELAFLMRKASRIKMQVTLEECIKENFYAKGMSLLDLDVEDILRAYKMNFTSDPFDALIAATARRVELPLITGDTVIQEAKQCEVYW